MTPTADELDPATATVTETEPVALAEPPEPEPVPASEAEAEPASEAEADADAETEADGEPEAEVVPPEPPPPPARRWYVIKVASNREESTKRNIERQIKIEGLEAFFEKIEIPYEIVIEVKTEKGTTKAGDKTTKTKKVEKKIKKFPGYVMAQVEWTPEVQAMLRGVSGVSGFLGSKDLIQPPQPMSDSDVQKMLGVPSGKPGEEPVKKAKTEVVKLNFEKGDKVRIREGAFANFEGEVKAISEPKEAGEHPIITVGVQVLGRETTIEMEFWQVDKL